MRRTSFSSYSRLFRMKRRNSCCFFCKKRKRTSNALNVCNFRWNSLYFEWKTFSLYIKQLSQCAQCAQCAQYGSAWFAWKWQGQTTHYYSWLSLIIYHFEHKCLFYAVRQSISIIDNNTWFHLSVRMCRLFWALQRICHIQYLQPCQWNRYNNLGGCLFYFLHSLKIILWYLDRNTEFF